MSVENQELLNLLKEQDNIAAAIDIASQFDQLAAHVRKQFLNQLADLAKKKYGLMVKDESRMFNESYDGEHWIGFATKDKPQFMLYIGTETHSGGPVYYCIQRNDNVSAKEPVEVPTDVTYRIGRQEKQQYPLGYCYVGADANDPDGAYWRTWWGIGAAKALKAMADGRMLDYFDLVFHQMQDAGVIGRLL